MTSCTIIISCFESSNFLRATIRQMKKYANENVRQKIIVADQSCRRTHSELLREYSKDLDVNIVWMQPLYSGYGLDWIFRHVEIDTEYIAQYHCDCFPIHKNHLYLPIRLIEEYNLSFVGQLQFISDGTQSIYPPHPIFAMAQCFNVAKTETYRELSLQAGFTRFHNRPQSGLSFANGDWSAWANADYANRGSDDDIVAFSWEDCHREHDKLGLAITGYIQPSFGRIIEDVVFHFGSANEARSNMHTMPELYRHYTQRINDNYDDSLIDEMVNLAKANKPPALDILTRNLWNGSTKQSSPPPQEMNGRIEELKSTF